MDRSLSRAHAQYYAQPDPFEPSNEAVALVDALLDQSRDLLHTPDETFTHCLLCDGVESHDDGCPIPALTAWREAWS